MRWYWIDRFLEFESGRYAKAMKNISLAEDYLHEHFPRYPVMPKSLIIEGLAPDRRLVGVRVQPVLQEGHPGEDGACAVLRRSPARRHAGLHDGPSKPSRKTGASVRCTSHRGDMLQRRNGGRLRASQYRLRRQGPLRAESLSLDDADPRQPSRWDMPPTAALCGSPRTCSGSRP